MKHFLQSQRRAILASNPGLTHPHFILQPWRKNLFFFQGCEIKSGCVRPGFEAREGSSTYLHLVVSAYREGGNSGRLIVAESDGFRRGRKPDLPDGLGAAVVGSYRTDVGRLDTRVYHEVI